MMPRPRFARRAPWPALILAGLVLAVVHGGALRAAEAADQALAAALRAGGHVVLMRHALAPGGGDPPGFRVDDCATQRNLSAAGRAQAQAAGERLKRYGIAAPVVYSSQWCRCLDTARLLGLGEVRPFAGLNSLFGDHSRAGAQERALRELIARHAGDGGTLVLVTHQANITALTGARPQSGEMLVLRREDGGGLALLGRIETAVP